MSASIVTGIASLLAAGVTMSYTESPLMGAGVGILGGAATLEVANRETDAATRQWQPIPTAAGAAPVPPQAQQAKSEAKSEAKADATPVAIATVGDTHLHPAAITVTPQVTVMNPPAAIAIPRGPSPWERDRDDSGIPTLDLTRNLSREELVFIVAKKNSGKSTTIRAAIRHRYEHEQGNCIFWIADPKANSWLGLEKTENYLFVEDENIEEFLNFLNAANEELTLRIRLMRDGADPSDWPLFTVIVDEWLTLRIALQSYDSINRTKLEQIAIGKLTRLATMGRELRVNLWMVTHSHICGDIGFSSGLRSNFGIYALGRKAAGKAAAVESLANAIADRYLLKDQDKRQDFLGILDSHDFGEAPVVFTPLDNGVLCQLPDLSSFVDWQYPLAQPAAKPAPQDVPIGELRVYLERIAQCKSKAAMSEFLDAPKGGSNPKYAEACRWYELVHSKGVDAAYDQVLAGLMEEDE